MPGYIYQIQFEHTSVSVLHYLNHTMSVCLHLFRIVSVCFERLEYCLYMQATVPARHKPVIN